MTIGDLTLRPIQLQWPNQEYAQGQVYQAMMGPFSMTGATVYGWPSGPTHPKALPRFLVGDLNHPSDTLQALELMKAHGWRDVQEWGQSHGSWDPQPTCKGSTTIDFVMISPELVPVMRKVESWPLFSDHLVLGVCLDLPVEPAIQRSWPLPRPIDWTLVDLDAWSQQDIAPLQLQHLSPDDSLRAIFPKYEDSFDGFCNTPDHKLPPQSWGRTKMTSPKIRPAAMPLLRPSRPGELSQSSDFLGRSVQRWFLQLRRVQSLVHSLRANKQAIDAQIHRAELWGSIRRGKGFQDGFFHWWKSRPVQLQNSPTVLPEAVPTVGVAQAIFTDLEHNYRRLESWRSQQRQVVLEATLQQRNERLFAMIKPEAKQPLHCLTETTRLNILSVDESQQKVHLDARPSLQEHSECYIDDLPVQVTSIDSDVVHLNHEWLLQDPRDFTILTHHSSSTAILEQLETFWSKRWWKATVPSESDWTRMFAFLDAYFPRREMPYTRLLLVSNGLNPTKGIPCDLQEDWMELITMTCYACLSSSNQIWSNS